MSKRALISVSDKAGVTDLARGLADLGWEIVSTGGTARAIAEASVPVTPIEEITGFPEILGGRVKTLHPAVHGGILARRDLDSDRADLERQGIAPIDLVVCNLYPFQQTVARPDVTLAEAVEQIDIGGVTLLRAAAKNFAHVAVVTDPADYDVVLKEIGESGAVSEETRRDLALKAFEHTAAYDAAISRYLQGELSGEAFPRTLALAFEYASTFRYGENPHQAGALYRLPGGTGAAYARQLHGKGMSYTNWLDADGAWLAANDFSEPTVAIIKHASPCGIASADTLVDAYRAALASDPISAFGGVVAVNRPLDLSTAQAIDEIFTEIVMAPAFEEDALALLRGKKNRRLLEVPSSAEGRVWDLRGIDGGLLVQERDYPDPSEDWKAVTERAPADEEMAAMRFGWRAIRHVKSNAILFAKGTATVGIGTGQPSRVDSVRLAAQKAGDAARGAIMASDAFFPFPDGVEVAAEAGVTAVVQPGGSIRDELVIEAANKAGMAMVFTGRRHFRH
jgi:phosphoribosylaminoimidazolecarboxamide formyltransferase/IMP cyclohydrolase